MTISHFDPTKGTCATCGKETRSSVTEMCNSCVQLRTKILNNPCAALKVFQKCLLQPGEAAVVTGSLLMDMGIGASVSKGLILQMDGVVVEFGNYPDEDHMQLAFTASVEGKLVNRH